ncbi:hypothetical protein GR183_04225 [Stappia sp. GBMRC 2046]|uniref:Uncharacterized protein n=1 Tax=Stappia sediminis TaxID=2692190 RepID=A0A7X3LS61_9HYPH|nr:hypothetical protein [Stappia sediminis]MXN64099.1 hypothetical protein [Stappia sediminis]
MITKFMHFIGDFPEKGDSFWKENGEGEPSGREFASADAMETLCAIENLAIFSKYLSYVILRNGNVAEIKFGAADPRRSRLPLYFIRCCVVVISRSGSRCASRIFA